MLQGDDMRTRTVIVLLSAVVALGIGVDLAGGTAGEQRRPVLTDATVTACAPAACSAGCPRAAASAARSAKNAARRTEPPAARRPHRRLAWHCGPKWKRRPAPDRSVTRRPSAPGRAGAGRAGAGRE
jgi:hypothetical protein